MRNLLLILLWFGATWWDDFHRIARTNRLKDRAEVAFQRGDVGPAILHYQRLDSLSRGESGAVLNLAHSYYRAQQPEAAQEQYARLTADPDLRLRSVAHQQMGVLAFGQEQIPQALHHAREALRADPANADARYNYELLRKLFPDTEPDANPSPDQDKPEDNTAPDQEKGEKKEGEGESQEQDGEPSQDDQQPGEEGEASKPQDADAQPGQEGEPDQDAESSRPPAGPNRQQLEEMNLTEEKARMILEAMRNSEIQYLQQRKHQTRKSRDSDRPDW